MPGGLFFLVVVLGLDLLLLLSDGLILSCPWRDWSLKAGVFVFLLSRQAKPQFCPLR